MSHYITKCRGCQTVVEQCRCPSPTKEERWVKSCPACPSLETAATEPAPAPQASERPQLRLITGKKPWPELIEHLKSLLARAEAGDLCSFGFVSEESNGDMIRYAYHGQGSYPIKMVGQLDVLKHAIIKRNCTFEED